ncbi:MAG: GNAT family N-acetyltransferase [Parvibaculaceae bacterium]
MSAIEIRREDPRAADVTKLIRDLDEMFHRLYPAESNHLVDIETLASPDIHFFVARRDGKALGCGALWHRDPAYGEVKRVYVRPEARGLKLSKLILTALEDNARAHGLKAMKLETGTLQPEALGLFAAWGFTRCGPYADYPTDDPYSVFMEKRVD